MKGYTTIGIAGHIDHGKTALTKQLTMIDTDRLKEEKERAISIENGFAFIEQENKPSIAVVDVPGHARFIRQMIAGIAGIDFVLLVIAADEGVMPQTREHMDILRLLGIQDMIVVVTKRDRVEEEWLAMVTEDIQEFLSESPFQNAPFYYVDSLSGNGIDTLKKAILNKAEIAKRRSVSDAFRLPVDSVFTLKGIGTIVRGTIFNGEAKVGEELRLLPGEKKVKVKGIQVHHHPVNEAQAGQRAAFQLNGLERDEVRRGDVLVAASKWYQSGKRIDIKFDVLKQLKTPFKQHSAITCHIGATVVQGRIIFFDRKQIDGGESIYCQVELHDPIVAVKGDRMLIRRPTPAETIGGAEVLNHMAEKHKFGSETIAMLKQLSEGTPAELIKRVLKKYDALTKERIQKESGVDLETVNQALDDMEAQHVAVKTSDGFYMLSEVVEYLKNKMVESLHAFHLSFPMRTGRSKADLLGAIEGKDRVKAIALSAMMNEKKIVMNAHTIAMKDFEPHLPKALIKPVSALLDTLSRQELETESWTALCGRFQIDLSVQKEVKHFLLHSKQLIALNEDMLISYDAFLHAINRLKQNTGQVFSVKEAKAILQISRKYMMPFLEGADREGWTKRLDNQREWQKRRT